MWPFRRSKNKQNTSSSSTVAAKPKPVPRYDAVEVVPAAYGACPAVLAIAGKRFLSRELPRLPLPDCDKPHCECGYRRHRDRRAGSRRSGGLQGAKLEIEQEQRDRRTPGIRGRRRTDGGPR